MPRNARVVIPDCPHHVTQRGSNRQDVFFTDEDREVYLAMLAEQCERFGLSVEGYCLMTNHVHLVATPRRPDSPAKAVGRTNLYYTRYVNALHGRSGHLWQDRKTWGRYPCFQSKMWEKKKPKEQPIHLKQCCKTSDNTGGGDSQIAPSDYVWAGVYPSRGSRRTRQGKLFTTERA